MMIHPVFPEASRATGLLRLATFVFSALLVGACTSKSEGLQVEWDTLRFVDIHEGAGITNTHGFVVNLKPTRTVTGGVACADYDRDGDLDIYMIAGDHDGNWLYRNKGDGSFEDVSEATGTKLAGGVWSGCTFAHLNDDIYLDLFICAIAEGPGAPCILLQQPDGTFKDGTPGSGLDRVKTDSFSCAFADYDRDGDLDMFLTQWTVQRGAEEKSQHLWQNNGNAVFTDVSEAAGVTAAFRGSSGSFTDLSFTPNFVDVNSDGWPDLLVTGDLGTNLLLMSDQKGGFRNATTDTFLVDHSTGAAIGDYDNDGDLDWFVSGVYGTNATATSGALDGNRLFRNEGDGTFTDVTDVAGVREGGWGWAASFADLNNDGVLDLVQVNGFGTSATSGFSDYFHDPSRLFMGNGDGTFTDRRIESSFLDDNLARGLVCADFDRDGFLDIFVANILGTSSLWHNVPGVRQDNSVLPNNRLTVALTYKAGNYRGIGARITITAGGKVQMRELRAGSHYVSQNPAEAHFGLGATSVVDQVEVIWPDQTKTTITNPPINELLRIKR